MDYRDKTFIGIIIIAIACLFASASRADIVIDMGDIGTVTIANAAVDTAKAVLDKYMPPLVNEETGEVIPWTGAEYKANLQSYILRRGWDRFVQACQSQYVQDNPPTIPQASDYMTFTPAP